MAPPLRIKSMSTACIVILGIIGMVEYSMVMPSMADYVGKLSESQLFYGLCVGLFSFARVCSMPLLGYWSDRRPMMEPLVFSIVVSIAGNLCYAFAEWADTPWLILLGRAIVGIGAANNTLAMAYVTRLTDSTNRTKVLAMLNGLNLLGIVLGPVTNAIVKSVEWQTWHGGPTLDMYTNPGWFMTLLLLAMLLMLSCFFHEPPILSNVYEIDTAAISIGGGNNAESSVAPKVNSLVSTQLSVTAEATVTASDGLGDDLGTRTYSIDKEQSSLNGISTPPSGMMYYGGATTPPVHFSGGSTPPTTNLYYRSSSGVDDCNDSDMETLLCDTQRHNSTASKSSAIALLVSGNEGKEARGQSIRHFRELLHRGASISFVIAWTNNFTLSGVETALPVMTKYSFHWDVVENAVMYMVIGLAIAIAIILVVLLTKHFVDKAFIIFGTGLLGVALSSCMVFLREKKMNMGGFVGCTLLLIFSIPVMGNPNVSLYSKHVQAVGAEAQMGLFIGVLQSVNGLSRSVAPIFAGWALHFDENAVAFAGPLVFWALSTLTILLNWNYLRDPSMHSVGCNDRISQGNNHDKELGNPILDD